MYYASMHANDDSKRISFYQLIAGLSAVAVILTGCTIILAPFVSSIILSTIFALATWPAFDWLHRKLHMRTTLAASTMTLSLIACFVFPMVVIGNSVAEHSAELYNKINALLHSDTVATAEHLKTMPVIGGHLAHYWTLVVSDQTWLDQMLEKYASPTSKFVINLGTSIGFGLLHLILGVLLAYFFFRHGHVAAERIKALIDKFGGEQGRHLLRVSKNTLIGVVYGIMGTALAQGVLAAFGFWVSGVPGAPFLGLLTFFLSLIPVGPPLIWIPASLWLYSEGNNQWAVFLILWGLLVISSVDNFLKPYFISRGSHLPLLLVLLGVVGGVMAFGFIGLFIGPTLLALAYSLLIEWSTVNNPPAA